MTGTDARRAPVLPLRDVVVLPGTPMPLLVGRPASVGAVRAAGAGGLLLLVTQRRGDVVEPTADDLYDVGTLARIDEVIALPDGHVKVLLRGEERAGVGRLGPDPATGVLWAEAAPFVAHGADHPDVPALVRMLREAAEQLLKLDASAPAEMLARLDTAPTPGALGDLLAATLSLSLDERQQVLAESDLKARLELLLRAIQKELGFLEVQRKLRSRVDRDRERRAEDAWFAQGEGGAPAEPADDGRDDLAELAGRLAGKALPDTARDRAERELRRLGRMNPMSAEAAVVRAWIDWVLALPWTERSARTGSLHEASAVLDADHHGLNDVKERVLEHLAVDILAPEAHGPILCLVGPPGVGKTSLARSIARATGRPFARIALGGVRDEAEIRGHRRTYIGALPGRIVHAMRRAGAVDAVLLLDEVDKLASDLRGDPASALLEVLDPEQNATFSDHYLDLDYDLSHVLFVCTANRLDDIPLPLRDRLEILELTGYTEPEKREIASRYLVPRQRRESGLADDAVTFTPEALEHLLRRHTREAGVRALEREVARVCRKLARRQLEGTLDGPVEIDVAALEALLGPGRYDPRGAETDHAVGLVKGLSVGHAGGEVLDVEVAWLPGKGRLRTTGRPGEVLKESAEAGLTWLRSRAARLGLPVDLHEAHDLHIHYPGLPGGVEGPSAGIAMATAIASALLDLPVRRDVAMTGEITLRGRVLPVGGIKEKVLAAHRGGLRTVVLPKDNARDLRDIPSEIRAVLDIRLVSHMDEVLPIALVGGSNVISSAAPSAASGPGPDVLAVASDFVSPTVDAPADRVNSRGAAGCGGG